MTTKIYRLIVLVFVLFYSPFLFSQDILGDKDLSSINIDKLPDAEIIKYQQQLKVSGLSEAQAEQIALQRGFPAAELEKLRLRLSDQNKTYSPTNSKPGASVTNRRNSTDNLIETTFPSRTLNALPKVFGLELFTTASLSFQPDLRIATPVNYELGPDDELLISVYGLQEVSFNLTVSPEGTIYVPNVGEIKVVGETIESATSRIKNRMASIAYGSLRSGASRLSVSLGKIRSIRVTVLGAARPGTYTVSSLSTLFNVLYMAGGPSDNGSLREIELLRNNKVERKIDLYSFLLAGNQADNVRVRENDVVRIPVYKKRVEIAGEVKRAGIFELVGNEKLSDLLRFVSGFTDSAYRASIKIITLTNKDKRVKDLEEAEYNTYIPHSSDFFEISKILNRFQNRVIVSGAVLRPGIFEITPDLTVGQLIKRAEGLREDAYTLRGQLLRLKSDLTTEIVPFDVLAAINGITDIKLLREDNVIISSIFELRDKLNVIIQGEVRRPGTFVFADSLSLKDLILQAGGFTDAAFPQKIEIARMIRRDTLTASDVRLSEVVDVRSMSDLSMGNKNISLKPFDVITVRRLPGFLELKSVKVSGQVQFPGPYVLSTRLERISDLIKRAGGLAPEAFADGAYLKRINKRDVATEIETGTIQRIQQQLKDTSGMITASVSRVFDQIPIELNKIITNPGEEEDMILKPEDELFVPRNDEEIKISGEILFPTQVPFRKGKDLKDYINDAGGFTENALKKKVYVIYPNGKAKTTHRFLIFKNYPELKPGSQIIAPKYIKRERGEKNPTQTIAMASAVASLAGVVIAIINLVK
jgi:protein involved in polysaccharide export with SLBB domain